MEISLPFFSKFEFSNKLCGFGFFAGPMATADYLHIFCLLNLEFRVVRFRLNYELRPLVL